MICHISIGDSAFQIEGAFIEAIDEVSLPNTITRLGTNVFLKLGVKSYKLNSTSSYISVQDGVLYIQTTSGKALYQYPIASDAVIFKVPADVDEILSGSFTGADEQNLKAIYVASRGSDNHLKINSGHGFNAAILTEDENIDVSFFDKYITYLKTTLESGDYSLAEDELTVNESGKGKLDELSFDGAGYYVFISDSSGTKKLFLITKNLEGDGYEATLLFDNYQE